MEFESRDDLLDCIRKADDTELGGRKIRLYEVTTFVCYHLALLHDFTLHCAHKAFKNNDHFKVTNHRGTSRSK